MTTTTAQRCSSCGAKIRWVVMAKTGRGMPVDAEPDFERGTIVLEPGDVAYILRKRELMLLRASGEYPLYISHFATCPDARAHRRR